MRRSCAHLDQKKLGAASIVTKPLMSPLAIKLVVVLVLKLAVLFGLWWGFVREQRVHVDADLVAAQLLQPATKPFDGKKP